MPQTTQTSNWKLFMMILCKKKKKKTIIYPASCLKDWYLIDLLWGSGKKSNKSSYCGNHDSIKMDKEISDPNINKGIPCLLRKISEKISHFFHLLRKPLIIFIKYYFIGMLLNQFIWRYVQNYLFTIVWQNNNFFFFFLVSDKIKISWIILF